MVSRIFLDEKSFHCLKQFIPRGSRSKSIIEKAVHLDFFGSNAVLRCTETEGRYMPAIAQGLLLQYTRRFALKDYPLIPKRHLERV